jgi:hypothetical protein
MYSRHCKFLIIWFRDDFRCAAGLRSDARNQPFRSEFIDEWGQGWQAPLALLTAADAAPVFLECASASAAEECVANVRL